MNARPNLDHYKRILDRLEPGTIERYDREESARQCFGTEEYEQRSGAYTFAALCRSDQAAILRALDVNLPTRTARPNPNTGTSYALKHITENFLGFYISNLQVKTAMRILGYKRGGDDLNPNYNVTKREWQAFKDLANDLDDRRSAACCRIARQEERQAAARYFYKMTKTA